jgi:hypothetical protein
VDQSWTKPLSLSAVGLAAAVSLALLYATDAQAGGGVIHGRPMMRQVAVLLGRLWALDFRAST